MTDIIFAILLVLNIVFLLHAQYETSDLNEKLEICEGKEVEK